MCMGLAGIVLYSTTILHKIVHSPPDIWDACSLGLARVVYICVCIHLGACLWRNIGCPALALPTLLF